jgi:Heterokaryon incompatibility protein (HET)
MSSKKFWSGLKSGLKNPSKKSQAPPDQVVHAVGKNDRSSHGATPDPTPNHLVGPASVAQPQVATGPAALSPDPTSTPAANSAPIGFAPTVPAPAVPAPPTPAPPTPAPPASEPTDFAPYSTAADAPADGAASTPTDTASQPTNLIQTDFTPGTTAVHADGSVQSSYSNIPVDLITGKTPAVELGYGVMKYHPLVKTAQEQSLNTADVIRVLIVHPGVSDAPVECSLKIRLLQRLDSRGDAKEIKVQGIEDKDLPLYEYIALSYAWEGQQPSKAIKIRHPTQSVTHLVTANLYEALQGLRNSSDDRCFWADAICMDQNNNEEKSQQLPLMSRIYSEAKNVCVWLGNEKPETAKAFKLMEEIRKWRQFSKVVEDITTCDQWEAFVKLISASWFRRRWVVQEIVLAGKAHLRCGPYCIEWTEFAQAVALFETMERRVKLKFRKADEYDNQPDMFGHFREYGACWLVKVTSDVVSRRDDGRVEKKTESLETLISSLTPFETGEPKDIVYSILSLAKDITLTSTNVKLDAKVDRSKLEVIFKDMNIKEQQKKDRLTEVLGRLARLIAVDRFPVDYNKRLDEICEDLYRFTTTQSRSLDLICRPWCPEMKDILLPTWVRTLKYRPYILNTEGDAVRVNADTLVGLPGHSPYKASGSLFGNWKFERDDQDPGNQDPGTLVLSAVGFQLDIVSDVEDAARGGVIPSSWLDPKYKDGTANKISEPFWRTMVAGKGPDGKNASTSYSLFCQEMFQTQHDINLVEEKQKSSNQVLIEFINRVLSVIYGRKLARTQKHRRLALLPPTTKDGDVICILYGCSVPVVLRNTGEKTKGSISGETNTPGGRNIWELVGESYMYGMMFGDALVARREGFAREQDFYRDRKEFVIR